MRVLFDYQRPTPRDGRIVIGGSDAPYFANDALSSGNYKPALRGADAESLHHVSPTGGPTHRPCVGRHDGLYHGLHSVGRRDGRRPEHLLWRRLQWRGVAFSQTAGRIICELMTGEQSELTRLFVVNHQMPYLGPSSTRILFERLYKWHLLRTAAKTVR